jgi:Caspase domain
VEDARRRRDRRTAGPIANSLAAAVILLSITPLGLIINHADEEPAGAMRQVAATVDVPSPPESTAPTTAVAAPPRTAALIDTAAPAQWKVVKAALPEPPPVPTGGDGVWAVSIGVNRYANGHNLNDADNDADALDQALGLYGVPADHRLNLRDRPAADIRAAARWLDAHAGPSAIAVFFFAGHVDRLGQGMSIMGSDDRGVSAGELAALLQGLPARRAWIVIAGCYSGAFTPVLAPGRILTAASSASRVSYESQTMRRSYLVEYMVQRAMVDGQASGSIEDAFDYARQRIHQDWPGNEPLQWDDGAAPLRLGPDIASRPVSPGEGGGSSATPATTTWTPAPTTTTTTLNTCSYWSAGMVRCQ